MTEILKLLLYFFIYSICGWILESIFKTIYEKRWVNSGFLHSPLCPIYGVGAVMMILFLSSFKNNIFLLFIAAFVILSVLEYFVGWLLETLFNTKYWDYTTNRLNIKGRVCIFNSVIWGILGVIFIQFLHPAIEGKVNFISNTYLLISNLILLAVLITDTVLTVVKVTSINKALEKFKDIGENLKEKLDELKELNINKELTIDKIKNLKESAIDKIDDVKEDIGEKIKGIEKAIEELKVRQNAINVNFYKKANRLKKAFPTMKSEKMSMFFEQKLDEKKLKQQKRNIKKNKK